MIVIMVFIAMIVVMFDIDFHVPYGNVFAAITIVVMFNKTSAQCQKHRERHRGRQDCRYT